MKRITDEDLNHIAAQTHSLWNTVKHKNIFITGGTGFFGKWLLESFLFVNKQFQLDATLTVLTRNVDSFLVDNPFYTEESAISFINGNVMSFAFPDPKFQFIIHAATDADAALNQQDPLLMMDTITNGTRRVLDFARLNPIESFLFTSSGAVYGKQPEKITHIAENQSFPLDINDSNSAYAEGKRMAELYCSIYHTHFNLPVKIARCFAFVGPYLPLDKHFAIGNFIINAIQKQDIIIKGDGRPYRSYLYAADLAIWLWTILLKGESNIPYNVGSDDDFDLKEIAQKVRQMQPSIDVKILRDAISGTPIERYVPDISRARQQLNLQVYIDIFEAIKKMFKFYN